MNLARLPVASELFAQWVRARGDRIGVASRPFTRDWETLLEDAGLLSAIDRIDAEREVRTLESGAWLELKSVRYRPTLIDRVVIPLSQEARWIEAFGFMPVTDVDARRFLEFDWVPDLAFLRDARLALPFEEAIRLNDFFRNNGASRLLVPIKERSLEIFGDEKRLDILAAGALFHEGRLTLNHLRCFTVIEPLGWHRGPNRVGPVIALENAATWESYRCWNMEVGHFSAVVYGQGNCFAERIPFLAELFRELGGIRPVFYFGDLDAAGLRIPARASRKAQRQGLPRVEPHEQSYRWLLDQAQRATPANQSDPARRADFDWLGCLAEDAWTILGSQRRLAQECVGLEHLLNSCYR